MKNQRNFLTKIAFTIASVFLSFFMWILMVIVAIISFPLSFFDIVSCTWKGEGMLQMFHPKDRCCTIARAVGFGPEVFSKIVCKYESQ